MLYAFVNINYAFSLQLLSGILLTQTELLATTKSNTAIFVEDPVLKTCQDILKILPPPLDISQACKAVAAPAAQNNKTILNQEILRYNDLLLCIKLSLDELTDAILGHVFMISRLEKMHGKIAVEKIPHEWTMKSYPSNKSLASYIRDLLERMAFLRNWIEKGEPHIYWFPVFYFPQAFVQMKKRQYCRNCEPDDGDGSGLDLVDVRFTVTQYDRTVNGDEIDLKNVFKVRFTHENQSKLL